MGKIKTLTLVFSLVAFYGTAMAADAVVPPIKPAAAEKKVEAKPRQTCKLDKKTKKQVCRKSPYKPAFKPEPYKGKPATTKKK